MKTLFLAYVLFFSVGCMSEERKMGAIKIYYIPFGVETYVPITPENIESSSTYIGDIEFSSGKAKKLQALLDASEAGVFEGDMLRLKLVYPDGEVFYVDNFGGQESGLKLNQARFKKLKKYIESLKELKKI